MTKTFRSMNYEILIDRPTKSQGCKNSSFKGTTLIFLQEQFYENTRLIFAQNLRTN